MKPIFEKKSSALLYYLMKVIFTVVVALWVPICLILAYTTEEGLGRALTLLLLPLVTFPLVIVWIALFFCIRYALILKTNDLPKTKARKAINILYLLVLAMMLVIVGCLIGSAASLLTSAMLNLYMYLTIPLVGVGAAIATKERKLRKELNNDQTQERDRP